MSSNQSGDCRLCGEPTEDDFDLCVRCLAAIELEEGMVDAGFDLDPES